MHKFVIGLVTFFACVYPSEFCDASSVPPLVGQVLSGTAPISNARIYLLAASSKGYNKRSESLLLSTGHQDAVGNYVLSNKGGFTLTDYDCKPEQQVYLLALGGNISSAGNSNSAIALVSALGPCPIGSQVQEPAIIVNEATTVASVYSLSGFITGAERVSSSSTPLALRGVRNAFATRFNLVDLSGVARRTTPAGNGTLVSNAVGYGVNSTGQNVINHLANILNTCVSSVSATSTECTALFREVTPTAANGCTAGAAIPTDTVAALRIIIQQTDCNVANIWNLTANSGPYPVTPTGVPFDWSISVTYATKVLYPDPVPVDSHGVVDKRYIDQPTGLPFIYSTPRFIAVDSQGNVWFTNSGTGIEKLGPLGQELLIVADGNDPSFPVALSQSYGLAIDRHDNVWITNQNSRFIAEFNSQGVPLSGPAGYPTPATAASQINGALAIDSNDEVWLLTLDGQLCNYSKTGSEDCTKAPARGPYTLPSAAPTAKDDSNSLGLAIDPFHRVWLAAHSNDNDTPEAQTGTVGVLDASGRTPILHEVAAPASTHWQAPMFLSSNNHGDIWLSNQFGGTTATIIGGNKTIHYQSDLIAFHYDEAKNLATLYADISGGLSDTGLCMPRVGMFDGDGSFWVGNYTELSFPKPLCGESLSHFDNNGMQFSPRGIGPDVLNNRKLMVGHSHHGGGARAAGPGGSDTVGSNDFDEPFGLAIDQSGNIWIADGQSYTITELIGAAVPVVTPLSPDHLGQRP